MLRKILPADDPAVQIMYLDEIAGKLAELNETLRDQHKLIGPTSWLFPRNRQYQFGTVPNGQNAVVYRLETPTPETVGIITEVANAWFPNTYLEWEIDREVKTVEYVIGEVEQPKEYFKGIPFYERVVWTAFNNDPTATAEYDPAEGHTFWVLCDGYFMKKSLFKRLAGTQGEPLH